MIMSNSHLWSAACSAAKQEVATLNITPSRSPIAIGSLTVNRLLKGEVSARYMPVSYQPWPDSDLAVALTLRMTSGAGAPMSRPS